ncbi:hypothetical protein CYMTET_34520 [Cymbomonas tetramitiformis]|uniref:Protein DETOXIFICATION n=1 Tax=Cymbomonas tetramitiformis TaxID=36881 RepID=A0AAE0KPS4_9CHLO|nr:hypothetical protein CYMTET_34520 [Cymbomonas tetramitiformis]|eukprot:gene13145-15520_t
MISIKGELLGLFKLAWPMILTFVASFLLPMITIVVVGHLGEDALAGTALGMMTANVTGFSMIVGLLSGMDTLCSQAFGAGHYELVGIHTQRAVLICLLCAVPISLLWVSGVGPLLRIAGQDPDLIEHAVSFTRILVFGLPAYISIESNKRFLQTQNVVVTIMVVHALFVVPHATLCWFLVYYLELGFIGAPISLVVTFWGVAISLLLCTIFGQLYKPETWGGIAIRQVLIPAKLWEYLRLGIPGMLMLALEWWSFEFMAFEAGNIGVAPFAAHSMAAQIVPLAFMVTLGMSVAISVRVGHLLGEGSADMARRLGKISLAVVAALAVVVATSLACLTRQVGTVFTEDADVNVEFRRVFPHVCIFIFFDYFQGSAQGVARGTGQQAKGAWIVVIGNYCIGLPLGFVLTFHFGYGIRGLWWGMIAGYCAVMFLFSYLLFGWLDWEDSAKEASARSSLPDSGVEVNNGATGDKVQVARTGFSEDEHEDADEFSTLL